MKIKKLLLAFSMTLIMIPVLPQEEPGFVVGTTTGDSANCPAILSVFRQFFRLNLYNDAIESWRLLFDECPSSSEQMYVDGVTMYRKFIEDAEDGPIREGLIDTLMLIYDRRMEYFDGEGNIIGRKGRDLLTYRRSNLDQVQAAYEMLKKSIEIEGEKSQEATMVLLINAGITLNKADRIEEDQVIDDYLAISGLLDQLEKRSSRWKRTREAIDELVLDQKLLTCEALNSYYGPQFEAQQDNKEFLEKVIHFYTMSGCDRSDMFVSAAEKLYQLEPSAESAHNLAIVFIAREDLKNAAEYLKMAVLGEDIDNETRAEWFYELALISSANGEFCDAITYAREATSFKDDLGKAYLLLGESFVAARKSLGDEFQQRTVFWAAADQCLKAASKDPSVATEAREMIEIYEGQAPSGEDIFFHDLKEGDPYKIGGCINESTTVRIVD